MGGSIRVIIDSLDKGVRHSDNTFANSSSHLASAHGIKYFTVRLVSSTALKAIKTLHDDNPGWLQL